MILKRAIGAALAALLFTGCQSQQLLVHGTSSIISRDMQSRIAGLEVGEATRRDVIELLGKPSSVYIDADGNQAFHYSSVATVFYKRYLFSESATVLTRQCPHIYACKITFDDNDTVRVVDWREGTSSQRVQR